MEKDQNFEQQLYQYRYLKEQRDMFAQQLEILNASLGNLLTTKTTAEKMKDLKDEDEILVPIGGMMSISAKIKNPEKVLLYISQDVIIEKDLDSSIEFLDKLIEQHKEQMNRIDQQLQNLDTYLQGMSNQLQQGIPQQ